MHYGKERIKATTIHNSTTHNAQKTAWRRSNDYWLKLCERIQLSYDTGDIRGLDEVIKIVIGPSKGKTALLKSQTGEIIKERVDNIIDTLINPSNITNV